MYTILIVVRGLPRIQTCTARSKRTSRIDIIRALFFAWTAPGGISDRCGPGRTCERSGEDVLWSCQCRPPMNSTARFVIIHSGGINRAFPTIANCFRVLQRAVWMEVTRVLHGCIKSSGEINAGSHVSHSVGMIRVFFSDIIAALQRISDWLEVGICPRRSTNPLERIIISICHWTAHKQS